MLAPALIAGRDIWSLLSIYAVQIVTGGIEGQPAWIKHQPIPFSFLTRNAPSFYQWFPANAPTDWKWLGIMNMARVASTYRSSEPTGLPRRDPCGRSLATSLL
jgi:hypothetical protein